MIDDSEFRVYMVSLPGDIHGVIRVDPTGFASIYINDSLSPAARRAALRHELRHLRRDDMHNDKSIWEAEHDAS